MQKEVDIIRQLGELALATRLRRLAERLSQEVGSVYKEEGFDFDPRWFAMLHLLESEGRSSILDIASALGITHPAVIQLTAQLEHKKLVTAVKDKTDGRKRLVALSAEGKKMLHRLVPLLSDIETANREFLAATGTDVLGVIRSMEHLLAQKSMYQRVKEKVAQRRISNIEIIAYNRDLKKDFKKLNYEWLKEYFKVEAADEVILAHPEKEILKKGGQVFFARENKQIVGTCAVLRRSAGVYEIAKMAVTKKARGKKIGEKLALAAIAHARSKHAGSIVLETSRKLQAALSLYEKLGFVAGNKLVKGKYERSTIEMKLILG